MKKKIFALCAAVIFACGAAFAAPAANAEKLSVICSNFAEYDFVRQITGDLANVKMLLRPGMESHSFDPTVKDILDLQNCGLFVYVGGDSDAWVDKVLASFDKGKGPRVVKLMDLVETVPEEIVEGMQHDHDHDGDDDHGHAHHDHGPDCDHGHDHDAKEVGHHHHDGEECDDPECECHHHHHHHADDVFSSWGKETPKKFSKEALEDMLHKLDSGDYGHILRAKGIVNGEGGKWIEFDFVPEEHEVRAGHPTTPAGCVSSAPSCRRTSSPSSSVCELFS